MERYIKAQLDGFGMKLVRVYNAFEGDTRVIGRDDRGVDHRFSVHWMQNRHGELKRSLLKCNKQAVLSAIRGERKHHVFTLENALRRTRSYDRRILLPYMSADGFVDCAYWCIDHPDEDWAPEEDDRSMEDELEFVEWGYTN